MWKEIRRREVGELRSSTFASRIRSHRIAALAISNRKEIVTPHRGAVNSLQIDSAESRYLLSGASDGSAAVFDIQQASDEEAGGLIARHKCLFVVDKHHNLGHKYAVSSVLWYPIDTGLFVTGSFDHYIKVWDTNNTQVVTEFKMPGKVHGLSMSSVATSHMLIAAGGSDVQVRLCDISSGAFTHTLSGHHDGIMDVEWSVSSEWVLMSGGCDGEIRFWDIRRGACYCVLDQFQSQQGRHPPLLQRASNKKMMTFNKSTRKVPVHAGSLIKSTAGQILHPGVSSGRVRAIAHYGVVTGLKSTADGFHLLSSGSDSRVRMWDIQSGCNTLVNFEATHLQTSKSLQMDVTPDSSVLFVPCMKTVKAFDTLTGVVLQTFSGHYEPVNCCCFSSLDQELYTGSNDRQIVVWSPPNSVIVEVLCFCYQYLFNISATLDNCLEFAIVVFQIILVYMFALI